MSLEIGNPIPPLTLPASGNRDVDLRSLAGRKTVIYFYPKDDTPGCTLEGKDFTALRAQFEAANAEVFGVSKDSVEKHDKFCAKHDLGITLLADEDGAACDAFDVIKEKNMYGKKYMGIERSTFLFDADGKLVREWRKVKVKGHADEVLDAVQSL